MIKTFFLCFSNYTFCNVYACACIIGPVVIIFGIYTRKYSESELEFVFYVKTDVSPLLE